MNSDLTALLEDIKAYLDQDAVPDRKFFATLQSVLTDNEFIQALSDQDRNALTSLNNNSRSRDINWYKTHSPQSLSQLSDIYFKALAFLNDKKKNISHFEDKTASLEKKISEAQSNIDHIGNTANLISGATVLTEYAKEFDVQARDHAGKAAKWLKRLILSIIGLVVLITLVLFFQVSEFPLLKHLFADDLRQNGNLTVLVLAIKAALVIAYLQVPYFLKRNYFAEKHLEQASIHRRNVLQALHAVYNTIKNDDEKDKIITTGAAIALSEAESGFLTRKEGAGGDDITDQLIGKVWK